MAASSDDAFYSAPDSPSNSTFTQNQQQHPSKLLNPNPDSGANINQHLMRSPTKWLSRLASTAGNVISSVLGFSDGNSSDDESDGDAVEMLSSHEDKYEIDDSVKKLNQGMALDQAEELKAIRPLIKSQELILQENLSREQSEKPMNPVPLLVAESSPPMVNPKLASSQNQLVQIPSSPVQASLEIHKVTLANADKSSEENKTTSSSSKLPLNPSTFLSSAPNQMQQLPPTETKSPLNSCTDHCVSPDEERRPFSDIIQHVNPLHSLSGKNQQSPLSNIIPPINPLPSPSVSKNKQQPSHSAPLLNPNAAFSSTNQKQTSPHSSIPSAKWRFKPRPKRNLRCLKYPLTSNHKEANETPGLIFDPMVEEGSGAKRSPPGNLKEVIELFSGNLDAKQFADMDLLDVLEMKGIVFEDPPWWSK